MRVVAKDLTQEDKPKDKEDLSVTCWKNVFILVVDFIWMWKSLQKNTKNIEVLSSIRLSWAGL